MIKKILFTVLLSLPALLCAEELAVVVGKDSPITHISDREIEQIFSGKLRNVDGNDLQALDLPSGDVTRNTFYQKLMGRSPDQMRSHWARLIFTGKGRPPREVNNSHDMVSMIKSSDNFIGYIPASEAGDNVRIIKRIP
jgi:ABC-type phosphate transport system substrate-binding protein